MFKPSPIRVSGQVEQRQGQMFRMACASSGAEETPVAGLINTHTVSGWWFGTWMLFFHSVGNVIIPSDEVIFFRGIRIEVYHQPRLVYRRYIYIYEKSHYFLCGKSTTDLWGWWYQLQSDCFWCGKPHNEPNHLGDGLYHPTMIT